MDTVRVRDIMVPLAEYAAVDENATLYEVVVTLEQYLKDKSREVAGKDGEGANVRLEYPHRAVLVTGKDGSVVGKISQMDILQGLEPKYGKIFEKPPASARLGFSRTFLLRLMEDYGLWNQPLDDICRKASEKKAREFMYKPDEGEFVREDATLNEAIHQLVVGHHQSLLVTRGKEIVGILRLTDVFTEITGRVKACAV